MSNPHVIIWVDQDPKISTSATKLKQLKNVDLEFFNQTEDCLNYIKSDETIHKQILCIITSKMQYKNRPGENKKYMNSFEMLTEIRKIWNHSYSPLVAMITVTADEQECKDYGYDIFVYKDRNMLQDKVIDLLKHRTDIYYKNAWRSPNLLPCQNLRIEAKKVLGLLKLNPKDMDPFVDRCYCKNCEPERIHKRGEEKYGLPIGWYRYGIKIREDYSENKYIGMNWPVAYHGTKKENIPSIVKEKRILFPGDKLKDGTIIKIRHNNCWAKHFKRSPIYLSPSILYASQNLYAPSFVFDDKYAKIVIQCKIKPGTYKKFKETLTFKTQRCDPDFSNDELEWVTDDESAVIPYGLLIGIFSEK